MQTTKQWQKPQLVILGRGTKEEAVLFACKWSQGNATGPTGPNCTTGNTDCVDIRNS